MTKILEDDQDISRNIHIDNASAVNIGTTSDGKSPVSKQYPEYGTLNGGFSDLIRVNYTE